jgi:hypothetical protein
MQGYGLSRPLLHLTRAIHNKEPIATWFRCLVKEVHHDGTKIAYMWHEMSFFTQWFPGHSIVLCIGAPKQTSTRLASSLAESTSPLNFSDPFSMHVPILDQMIILYDESVWQIRHMIRRREKVPYIGSYRKRPLDI